MPYLIDSDIVIDHLANVKEASQLLEQLAQEGIAISVITYMEAYQGVSRSPQPQIAHRHLEISKASNETSSGATSQTRFRTCSIRYSYPL